MTVDRDRPVVVRRLRAGEPGAQRVLLLHGLANSTRVWEPFVAAAATHQGLRRAEFWSADLPWRGTARREWSHQAAPASWLTRALEAAEAAAEGIGVVIAHSYAANALLEVLCQRGTPYTGLSGVVLVSPFYRPAPQDFDWATVAGLTGRFVDTMEEGIRAVSAARSNQVLHRAMAERVCEEVGAYGWARFFELYLRTPWLRTDRLRTRALILCGEDDTIAAPTESAALAASLPRAHSHEIAGCGHFPMLEQVAVFTGLVEEFCATDAELECNR